MSRILAMVSDLIAPLADTLKSILKMAASTILMMKRLNKVASMSRQ